MYIKLYIIYLFCNLFNFRRNSRLLWNFYKKNLRALKKSNKHLMMQHNTLRWELHSEIFEIKAFIERSSRRSDAKASLYFIQAQTQQTMRCLQEEFERLHQFLRDEEMIRISALKEEENQKSQMMKEKIEQIDREIESLSNNLGTIKNDLDAADMPFLQVRNNPYF